MRIEPRSPNFRAVRTIVIPIVATILMLGPACSPSFKPSTEVARAALEHALDAWRDGRKIADVADLKPPVQVVETEWVGGRKLSSYQILREEHSESDKRFTVKLTYAAPAAEAEVVYVVVGTDPVSVFREEDFMRSMNMDNNPTPKKKRSK